MKASTTYLLPYLVSNGVYGVDTWRRDWGGALWATDTVVLAYKLNNATLKVALFQNSATAETANYTLTFNLTNVNQPLSVIACRDHVFIMFRNNLDNQLYYVEFQNADAAPTPVAFPGSAGAGTGLGPAACRVLNPGDGAERILVFFVASNTSVLGYYYDPAGPPTAAAVNPPPPGPPFNGSNVGVTSNPQDGRIFLVWQPALSRLLSTEYAVLAGPTLNPGNASDVFPFGTCAPSAVGARAFANSEIWAAGKTTATTLRAQSLHQAWDSTEVLGGSLFLNPSAAQYRGAASRMHAAVYAFDVFTSKLQVCTRPLDFPDQCGWNSSTKVLFLRGPANRSSTIRATFRFPEPVLPSCVCSPVHPAAQVAIDGAPQVLRNASFTVAFTSGITMATTTYRFNQPNAGIKLQTAGGVDVNVMPIATGASSITFAPTALLDVDADYKIVVATDAQSVVGNQVWNPVTLNFHTEPAVSVLAANEVATIDVKLGGTSYVAGGDYRASATAQIRVVANLDPSPNSRDVSTATIWLNGTQIATVPLEQPAMVSQEFIGTYTFASLPGLDNTLAFASLASPSVVLTLNQSFLRTTASLPASGAANVNLSSTITITTNEILAPATVNAANVQLTRGGVPVVCAIAATGNTITIDPDDSADHWLRPDATYTVTLKPGVTDLIGNPLVNPTAWGSDIVFIFSTQHVIVPPTAIANLRLFSDPLLIDGLPDLTWIPATRTLYLLASATDLSSVTADITTATVQFAWAGTVDVALHETGYHTGQFTANFALTGPPPIYGFPGPLPPGPVATITVSCQTDPTRTSRVQCRFPQWQPAASGVNTQSGAAVASGATAVRLDSAITLGFAPPCQVATPSATAVRLTRSGVDVPFSFAWTTGNTLTLTPSALLQPATQYQVWLPYDTNSLRGPEGNPLVRETWFTFTTQATVTPPTSVHHLSVFTDGTYNAASTLNDGADLVENATVYCELVGSDGANLTVDTTLASTSFGPDLTFTETSANSGVYRGPATIGLFTDDAIIRIASKQTPTLERVFQVTFPHPAPTNPASGAANISVGTPIEVQLDRDIDGSLLGAATLTLTASGVPVPASWTWRASDRRLVATPLSLLGFGATHRVAVAGLRTMVGNTQRQTLEFSFTTQLAANPPVVVNTLRLFATDTWAAPLASGTTVLPEQTLYVEVVAVDASVNTTDFTSARWEGSNGATGTVLLVETGPNTGVFRGTFAAPTTDGITLIVRSSVNPAAATGVALARRPRWVAVQPANGATGVTLETLVQLTADKPFGAGATASGTVQLFADGTLVSAPLNLSAANRLRVQGALSSNKQYIIRTSSTLFDNDGLPLPILISSFTTIAPQIFRIDAFTDPTFVQAVSSGTVVESNSTIYVAMVGTDLDPSRSESSPLLVWDGLGTTTVVLSESTPGVFRGPVTVTAAPGGRMVMTAAWTPTIRTEVAVRQDFRVIDVYPSDGTVWAPADIWPVVVFSTEVDANTVANQVTLIDLDSNVAFPIELEVNRNHLTLVTTRLLTLSANFEIRVEAGIRDQFGRSLNAPFRSRFSVQPPPPPPSTILSLLNFAGPDYASATSFPPEGGMLYLELLANDPSPVTRQTSRVRINSSDGLVVDLDLALVETASASARYRGATRVMASAGVELLVRPMADRTRALRLEVVGPPRLIEIVPASGSTNLHLDQVFGFRFNNPLDISALLANPALVSVRTAGEQAIGFALGTATGPRELTIRPTTQWATATLHVVSIGPGLRDQYGNAVPAVTANFATRAIGSAALALNGGTVLVPRWAAEIHGELPTGPSVFVATTTDIMTARPELRTLTFVAATGTTTSIQLPETSPGLFATTATLLYPVGMRVQASLEFANRPTVVFVVASAPLVTAVTPAPLAAGVAVQPGLAASFSRLIALDSASGALRIDWASGSTIPSLVGVGTASRELRWSLTAPLPENTPITASMTAGLLDTIGAPLANPRRWTFTTRPDGNAPVDVATLTVFLDASYSTPLMGDVIASTTLFVEVFGDDPATSTINAAGLLIRHELASGSWSTVLLQETGPDSGRYRTRIDMGTTVPFVPQPGEWLELRSRENPALSRLLYFLASGAATPTNITALQLYAERHYAQPLEGDLAGGTVYAQVIADDRNHRSIDVCPVKVTSDTDPTGITLDARETGLHTGAFRTDCMLDAAHPSVAPARRLAARPGDTITVTAVPDPRVSARTRWTPRNRLDRALAWPSPCRGNQIWFNFYLTFPGDVVLTIYDVAGDEIATLDIVGREGENRILWPLPGSLANGAYIFKLELQPETDFIVEKSAVKGKFAVLR